MVGVGRVAGAAGPVPHPLAADFTGSTSWQVDGMVTRPAGPAITAPPHVAGPSFPSAMIGQSPAAMRFWLILFWSASVCALYLPYG